MANSNDQGEHSLHANVNKWNQFFPGHQRSSFLGPNISTDTQHGKYLKATQEKSTKPSPFLPFYVTCLNGEPSIKPDIHDAVSEDGWMNTLII